MLANESDLELYFSLDWEEKQFKSILKRKKKNDLDMPELKKIIEDKHVMSYWLDPEDENDCVVWVDKLNTQTCINDITSCIWNDGHNGCNLELEKI